MKKIILLTTIATFTFLTNCTSVSEDDLIEEQPVPTTVTYNKDIKPIIDNNCIFCHAPPPVNGAPNALINYTQVKNAVENSNLINRVSSQAGQPGAMPFGGPRLPQSTIDLIIQWNDDGLLEDNN